MKRFVWVVLTMGMVIAAGCGAAEDKTKARLEAADFTVADLQGNTLQLSALRGKVVLLDFWATWCSPCREEIPHFMELYAAYRSQGLEIVALALDQGGEKEVAPFVQENGISYPVAMGPPEIVQAYGGLRGIPTTFLIDRQGRIARRLVGYHGKEFFEAEIQALLAES